MGSLTICIIAQLIQAVSSSSFPRLFVTLSLSQTYSWQLDSALHLITFYLHSLLSLFSIPLFQQDSHQYRVVWTCKYEFILLSSSFYQLLFHFFHVFFLFLRQSSNSQRFIFLSFYSFIFLFL